MKSKKELVKSLLQQAWVHRLNASTRGGPGADPYIANLQIKSFTSQAEEIEQIIKHLNLDEIELENLRKEVDIEMKRP